MSLQRNSQKRSQSSTRVELARDLHDSLAQDLVAIGFKLDLFLSDLPISFRESAREIRIDITDATKRVRQELFALRELDSDYQLELTTIAKPLHIEVIGEISKLSGQERRIIDELVRNAATHSKGHNITLEIGDHSILVKDDGQGMHGISEIVEELGGQLHISSGSTGTQVEIRLP